MNGKHILCCPEFCIFVFDRAPVSVQECVVCFSIRCSVVVGGVTLQLISRSTSNRRLGVCLLNLLISLLALVDLCFLYVFSSILYGTCFQLHSGVWLGTVTGSLLLYCTTTVLILCLYFFARDCVVKLPSLAFKWGAGDVAVQLGEYDAGITPARKPRRRACAIFI